jgi:glucose/arabinose dehydrogenase
MSVSLTSLPRAALGFVIATCLCISGAASGANDPPPPDQAKANPQTQPAAKVVPLNSGISPQEFESDASKVTMERRPDGTRIYHANGQGMQSVVAHLGADGRIEYTCTDQVEQALRASTGAESAHEQ